MRHLLLCLLFSTQPALAQDHIRPEAILGLAAHLHRAEADIAAELAEVAPQFRATRHRAIEVSGDPFLALVTGAFGPTGPHRPAGLAHCARYGLETRDLLASHAASDPEVFPIVSTLRVGGDDTEVWPEDAIALFRCIFAWDDPRRIAPWTATEAEASMQGAFAQITRTDGDSFQAPEGGATHSQYGPDGFRLIGHAGPDQSYYRVESLTVVRYISHQRVVLRAFLLGGGV